MDFVLFDRYTPRRYWTDDWMDITRGQYETCLKSERRSYDDPLSFRNGMVASNLTSLLDEHNRLKKRAQQIQDLEREMEEHLVMYKEFYGIGGKLGPRYAHLQYRIVQMRNENKDLQKLTRAHMERCICAGNDYNKDTLLEQEHEVSSDEDRCQTRWAKLEKKITEFDKEQKRRFREFQDKLTRKLLLHSGTDVDQSECDLRSRLEWESNDVLRDEVSLMPSSKQWHNSVSNGGLLMGRVNDQGEGEDERNCPLSLKKDKGETSVSPVKRDEELGHVARMTSDHSKQLESDEDCTDTDTRITNNESKHLEGDEESCGRDPTRRDLNEECSTHNHVPVEGVRDTVNYHKTDTGRGNRTLMRKNGQGRKHRMMEKEGNSPRNQTHREMGEKIIEGLKRNLHERLYHINTGRPGSVLTRTGHYRRHSDSTCEQLYDDEGQRHPHRGDASARSELMNSKADDMFQNGFERMGNSVGCRDNESQYDLYKRTSRQKRDRSRQRKVEQRYLYSAEERDNILKKVKRCFINEVPFCIYSNYQRRFIRR